MHQIVLFIIIVTIASVPEIKIECRIVEVDYSEIAGEAESNKHNILHFLNETRIQAKYKIYFESLLKKLAAHPKPKRREAGSGRRIVAGVNTSIAALPWQVSLRDRTYPICGGSVITALWLLTAAHCLLKPLAKDLSVRLGSSWKTHGGQMYDVKETHVHPQYVRNTKVNDVGLIKLYCPLVFSATILPIKLIGKNSTIPANRAAIVSGWGKIRERGPSSTILQSSTVKTIAMKLCRNSGLQTNSINPISMFCAGSLTQSSADACQGDSGGPIVSDGILVGVVSWGLGCARGNFPGVYTRLSYPVIWDWVHSHITKPEVNSTLFCLSFTADRLL